LLLDILRERLGPNASPKGEELGDTAGIEEADSIAWRVSFFHCAICDFSFRSGGILEIAWP